MNIVSDDLARVDMWVGMVVDAHEFRGAIHPALKGRHVIAAVDSPP